MTMMATITIEIEMRTIIIIVKMMMMGNNDDDANEK